MSRYIDADALRKEHCEDCNAIKDDPNCDICATMQWVNDAPTADVAPVVHGRWLTWEEQFPGEIPKKKSRLGVFCSACHNHADNMFDYCPNCGAKMRCDNEQE